MELDELKRKLLPQVKVAIDEQQAHDVAMLTESVASYKSRLEKADSKIIRYKRKYEETKEKLTECVNATNILKASVEERDEKLRLRAQEDAIATAVENRLASLQTEQKHPLVYCAIM